MLGDNSGETDSGGWLGQRHAKYLNYTRSGPRASHDRPDCRVSWFPERGAFKPSIARFFTSGARTEPCSRIRNINVTTRVEWYP